jgi:futalosine hydrolase
MQDVLIVVATELERQRLPNLPAARVVVSGIGAVNAALATQRAILDAQPPLVLSVGIGGAYPSSGLHPGDVAVSSEILYAGLGAMDGSRFLDLEMLGFALLESARQKTFNALPVAHQAQAFSERSGAAFGSILTLETVTGSLAVAQELEARCPGALVESMEGAGVAHAALQHGVPTIEVRGVSNMVGPRDRSSWRIREALEALGTALERGWAALG